MTTHTKNKFLSSGSEWTFELLEKYEKAIGKIAERYQLTTYPNQIEIISSEQMMNAYAYVGMPIGYDHWSFGKQFLNIEKNYKRGRMDLAYEMVINSNPCITYLMEENNMSMQVLVIAHACYGHNSFFKNNYLFKNWTNASSIIDYLLFAKNYVKSCEKRHGLSEVEEILDSCHALMNYGVDRYKHPAKMSLENERVRQKQREEYLQSQVNELWRTLPEKSSEKKESRGKIFPPEPQENILYFIEKNAPLLQPWQREIVRIVRKISQYFYPQRQTKVMNEGWATFWHYTIINTLYDEGLVPEELVMEALQSHTSVIYQPPFDSPHYYGINPYTLGFRMFSDLRRMCEEPTPEDEQWFPDLVNQNWLTVLHSAMQNFKDESFIAQYLSPKVMRDLHLFSVVDNEAKENLEVSAIHDDPGYQYLREMLSNQYNLSVIEPNIQVHRVDLKGDRSLVLQHIQREARPLEQTSAEEVMKHLYHLWGFPVKLESMNEKGEITKIYDCPMIQTREREISE